MPASAIDTQEAEQDRQVAAAYLRYVTLNDRLQRVGRQVLMRNAELCSRRMSDIGVQAVTVKTFPKPLREYAETQGFDVEPRALFSVNNALPRGAKLQDAEGQEALIYDKGFDGQIFVDGEAIETETTTACGYPITLVYSPAVNAYATGRAIRVTTGMMEFADDDELAVIIGHELAHNTEGHVYKIIAGRIAGLGTGRFSRIFESEADYVGLYYAARAGFDINQATGIWRRMGLRSIRALDRAKSHPTTPERYVRLSGAILEIERKIQSGAPLLPERKS